MPAPAATAIRLRFTRSFYVRHAFVGGLFLFLSIALMLLLKQLGPLRFLAPVVFTGPWLFFVLREYRLAARLVDEEGVTRHDGQRFLWRDLHHLQEVYMRLTPGQQGPLNQIDLIFAGGRARILYMVLENGWDAILFSRKKATASMNRLRNRLHALLSWRAHADRTPEWSHGERPRAASAWPERSPESR